MNTTQELVHRHSGSLTKLALMGITIGVLTAMTAQQISKADDTQPTTHARDGSRAQPVSLAGIDLSSASGQRAARARVQEAARKLCMQVEEMNDLSRHTNYLACVDQSVSAALRQIEPPSMVAAAKSPGREPR